MTSPTTDEPTARAAVILDDGSADVDALLAAFAAAQQRAGRRVRGLVMTRPGGDDVCGGAMVLVDVATGDQYLASQALGRGSSACRTDPQGFARASRVLREALAQAPDLVICNRFAGMEAEGEGFAEELLALMVQGVPLLTVVAPRHLERWQRFSGGTPVLLPQPEAWQRWLDETLQARAELCGRECGGAAGSPTRG